MNSETVVKVVTITIDGAVHVFKGDDLTSPLHQAEAFIHQLAKKEELF